jgi:hypothetical protein
MNQKKIILFTKHTKQLCWSPFFSLPFQKYKGCLEQPLFL